MEARALLEQHGTGPFRRNDFAGQSLAQPYVSVEWPHRGFWGNLTYKYFAGSTATDDFSLSLHGAALATGLSLDPFKVILRSGGGVEMDYLKQKGEIFICRSSRKQDRFEWGLVGLFGASWEPFDRIGLDLRLIWRWHVRPTVQGRTYDLSGRSLNLGISYFLRP